MNDFIPSNTILNNINDLENFLNEYEKYLRDTYKKEKLVEYQWKELLIKTNDIIERTISSIPKIYLKVSNIKKEKFSSDFHFSSYFEDSYSNVNEYKKLRGDENIRKWTRPSYDEKEKEIYIITYDIPNIINSQLGPFRQKGQIENSVPNVTFKTYIENIDDSLRVGSEYLFNLNSVGIIRYLGKEEIIHLNYFENFLKPKIVEKSNSNCFVVTTTMGDTNHPVVVDFRRYRDEVLLKSYLGVFFIKLYYKIGPFLSRVIKMNDIFFSISKKFILILHKRIKK